MRACESAACMRACVSSFLLLFVVGFFLFVCLCCFVCVFWWGDLFGFCLFVFVWFLRGGGGGGLVYRPVFLIACVYIDQFSSHLLYVCMFVCLVGSFI